MEVTQELSTEPSESSVRTSRAVMDEWKWDYDQETKIWTRRYDSDEEYLESGKVKQWNNEMRLVRKGNFRGGIDRNSHK